MTHHSDKSVGHPAVTGSPDLRIPRVGWIKCGYVAVQVEWFSEKGRRLAGKLLKRETKQFRGLAGHTEV